MGLRSSALSFGPSGPTIPMTVVTFDQGKMHKKETYPDRAKVLNWSACKLHPSIVIVKTQTLLAANAEPGSEAERRRRFAAKLAVLELHSKGLRMAWGLSV